MEFRTIVDIPSPEWRIEPCERMLFVGSCFADNIGRRFQEEKFRAVVNPYGVMYNPASILHTVERLLLSDSEGLERLGDKPSDAVMPFSQGEAGVAVLTLGTNRVYELKATGEIVSNCSKRPQSIFSERSLTVDECAACLQKAIDAIRRRYPLVHFIITVSPIRYRKYGYHGSRLAKSVLMLASNIVEESNSGVVSYFPSYEIMDDELRDYRFYQPDMLHPTAQAVDYMFSRLAEAYFSPEAKHFLEEWRPLKEFLGHRPIHPESETYRKLMEKMREFIDRLRQKYPGLEA